ncbi:unnamed protein product [Schistosoma mansoni]|uniref:Smp_202440 n=1 Tax=Schistosoma mansoni TaxID=6183 RepID=UPI00022C8250|nr:unnamed protein product [Schistosoma mansoni]|eukprot:XP_018644654.1 unnamed protein product [Schistosoma mansoni]
MSWLSLVHCFGLLSYNLSSTNCFHWMCKSTSSHLNLIAIKLVLLDNSIIVECGILTSKECHMNSS